MIPRTDKRRGFTLVELLVVIAIIAIIAGLVVPALMNAQSSAFELQCLNNLRGIQQIAFTYASARKAYPYAKIEDPPAHESLNDLVKSSYGASLEPEIFICPEQDQIVADSIEDEDGELSFLLDEDTLSYTWVAKRSKTIRKGPLSSDKYYSGYTDDQGPHEGHRGKMNIVTLGGRTLAVEILPDGEFAVAKYRMSDEGIPVGLTR